MSKKESEVPERLRAVGARELERRLVGAAGRERPSGELSERMARAIGISLPTAGGAAGEHADPGGSAPHAATASGSPWPWAGGALVTAAVAVGVAFALRPGAARVSTSGVTEPARATVSAVAPPEPAPVKAPLPPGAPARAIEAAPLTPAPSSAQRGGKKASGDIAEQIALVDAARSAVRSGDVERALAAVRKYQAEYPRGAFRPEAAALKVEALVKAGRTAEARAAAERFVVAYGPGPLTDRVALLAGISHP
jgi:TolA-binding protein